MRKTVIIIAVVLAVIIFVLLAAVLFIPAKRSAAPAIPTPASAPAQYKDGSLVVSSPLPNSMITSPVVIEGTARGTWYFEASFPIRVFDGDGTELGVGIAQAQGNWMTLDLVPFKVSVSFKTPKSSEGTLLLHNDNPSGLPENDKELRVPIRFGPASAQASCKPTGCSGQICSDQDVITTCEYREEYACYKTAKCERQSNGQCGWTQTPELQGCLKNATKAPPVY